MKQSSYCTHPQAPEKVSTAKQPQQATKRCRVAAAQGGASAVNPLILMTAAVLLAEGGLQLKPAGPVPEQAGDIVQQEGAGQFVIAQTL